MDIEAEIARHYTRSDLTGAVLRALRDAGHDLDAITTADLAPVDEFHLGWHPQTVDLAGRLGFPPGPVEFDRLPQPVGAQRERSRSIAQVVDRTPPDQCLRVGVPPGRDQFTEPGDVRVDAVECVSTAIR